MARRKLDFHWNLRRLMAAHQMWKTTELVPLLRVRGVELSASQMYLLVTDKPGRADHQARFGHPPAPGRPLAPLLGQAR
jgi:Cro/C1-type HTH DNA-binding domain